MLSISTREQTEVQVTCAYQGSIVPFESGFQARVDMNSCGDPFKLPGYQGKNRHTELYNFTPNTLAIIVV